MADPLPLATFSFVMAITPGPNNLMLTVSGAHFGFRRTLPHMLGILLGCVLQLLAACAGLGALFTLWPAAGALRWVGAAYLLYLAWTLLASHLAPGVHNSEPISVIQAVVFQFLNPKAWIMSLTAAGVFLPRQLGALAAGSYMIGIMVLTTLPCGALWALFGTQLATWLTRPAAQRLFNGAMAAALGVTAVSMVL